MGQMLRCALSVVTVRRVCSYKMKRAVVPLPLRVRVRTAIAPPGRVIVVGFYPGLTPWAKLWRSSGAGLLWLRFPEQPKKHF